MHHKLKYPYFIPLALASLLASCVSDELDGEVADKGTELTFATETLSRAASTMPFTKFVVYGDKQFPLGSSDAPMIVFDKTEVEYINDKWSYKGTQFWFPKHEHSFVAVAPVSVLDNGAEPDYSNSQLSFSYTIPTTDGELLSNSDVTDIFAATHRRLVGTDNSNVVTLRFQHIMSRINIETMLDDELLLPDDFVEINKIEFVDFKTKATINILPAPRLTAEQTDDIVVETSDLDCNGNYIVEFDPPLKVVNNKVTVNLLKGDDAVIMLPQNFSADSNAKIYLSYGINGDPLTVRKSALLRNHSWSAGKNHTFRIVINTTGLYLGDTAIIDWDVEDCDDYDLTVD